MKIFLLFTIFYFGLTKDITPTIPRVRELVLIAMFTTQKSYEIPENKIDICEITVILNSKNITAHFGQNRQIGRVDIVFNDHWEEWEIFKEDLQVFIEIKNKIKDSFSVAPHKIYIRILPNEEQNEEFIRGKFKYDLKFKISCDNLYGRVNCNEDAEETDELFRDLRTGNHVCKNPETCFDDKICEEKENKCKNGAKCFKDRFSDNIFCECPDGFFGPYCEKTDIKITEELLLFMPFEYLEKIMKKVECPECPFKKCLLFDYFTVCQYEDLNSPQFICKENCDLICGDHICRINKHDKVKYYLKSAGEPYSNV